MKTFVVLNADSQSGKSEERFLELAHRLPPHECYLIRTEEDWRKMRDWIETRIETPANWIAAGGDGTVHSLLNELYRISEKKNLPDDHWRLGLVALGSSNDYHKRTSHQVSDRLRTDFDQSFAQSLLEITFGHESQTQTRYSFLNVGLGITAEGNWFFNRSALIHRIKRWSVNSAIQISAVRAFLLRKPLDVSVRLDEGDSSQIRLANLSIFLNPHFSGSFRYPMSTPLPPDRFGVGWVEQIPLHQLVPVFVDLMRGRFRPNNTCHLGLHHQLELKLPPSTPIEIDGEVWSADSMRIRIAPRKVYVCP